MNPFEKARVFISGGAGVIGCYLVEKLYQLGAQIFVGDLKPKPPNWPKEILYRQGDLNEITKEELHAFAPVFYFHLAATFERSDESYSFLQENFQHNLKLSHHLICCLKECPSLRKVIFASSYLIYDPKQYLFSSPQKQPISLTEDHLSLPRNLCGAAKFFHEQELAFVQRFHPHLSISSARIYRSYGKNSRDVISRWIEALLQGETIQVFCKEGFFDYVYAGDVAEGLLALAKTGHSGPVNLGRGRGRTISEVLEVLKQSFPHMRCLESSASITYEASQADMSLFQSLTGFSPPTDLEIAIPQLIDSKKTNL